MHVSSKRLTATLVLMLAGFAGVAQAAEFDVKLKAPKIKGAPELKSVAENYSATFARLKEASPTETVSNQALFLEHFDLKWQLTRAVDERQPLEDMSAIGLVKRDNGNIEIDLKAFPQWSPFAETLAGLMPALHLESLGPLLINRGFRDSDVTAIKNYVATHDLKAASTAKTLPIAISFSRLVKKYDDLKLPVSKDLVYSFIYQRSKAEAQAQREWAEGLLQVLDAQRVRVLHSYFDEMTRVGVWGPSDTDAGVASVLAVMRLPDYEQRVIAEAKGVTP